MNQYRSPADRIFKYREPSSRLGLPEDVFWVFGPNTLHPEGDFYMHEHDSPCPTIVHLREILLSRKDVMEVTDATHDEGL